MALFKCATFLVVVLCAFNIVQGFPGGAQQSACENNRRPRVASHRGAQPQLTPSPYHIEAPATYTTGPNAFNIIRLVSDVGSLGFKGFMIQAIRKRDNVVVGRFALEHPTVVMVKRPDGTTVTLPNEPPAIQALMCAAGRPNAGSYLTHTFGKVYTEITTYWADNDENVNHGDIYFMGSFVETTPIYWVNVVSNTMRQADAPTELPTEQPTEQPTELPTEQPTEPPTEPPTRPTIAPPAPINPIIINQGMNCFDCSSGWNVCGKNDLFQPQLIGKSPAERTHRCLVRLDKSGETVRSSADGFFFFSEDNLPMNGCIPGEVTPYGSFMTTICSCSMPDCNRMGVELMQQEYGLMTAEDYMKSDMGKKMGMKYGMKYK